MFKKLRCKDRMIVEVNKKESLFGRLIFMIVEDKLA